MSSCAKFDDRLRESLSGDLPPAERREFEQHLVECPSCLAILKGYLRAGAMAADAYPVSDEPTGPLPEALVRSVVAYVRKGIERTDKASGVA